MKYDLDYFTEFLADPSAFEFSDFYEMARKWGEYVKAHNSEFNYLADEEWREVRERLIAEFKKREKFRETIDAEWNAACEVIENIAAANPVEVIDAMKKQLAIMKKYQKFYKFTDEDITLLEKDIADYSAEFRKYSVAEKNAQMAQIAYEKTIADLDKSISKYQENTGKTPIIPVFPDKKKHKGN